MTETSEKKTKLILYGKPIWKGIIALSLPVFLANIVKTMQDLVDAVTLGQLPDITQATQSQGAVGLTWPIFFIFLSFGIGLSIAGNALIGQYVGKNDMKNAKKFANNVLLLSLGLGILFNIMVYMFGPMILSLMQAPGDKLDYAVTYIRIRSFGLPIMFLSFGFQAVRQSTGDTTTPVIVSTMAIVLNIILTPIFVLVFHWGIMGAGLSTMIANNLMLPGIIFFLLKSKTGIKATFNIKSFNLNIAKDLFNVAIPASIGQSIQAVGFVILNAKINFYGDAVYNAFYLGNRINSIVLFPIMSISAIVAIYIAQNVGAGNIARAKQAIRQSMFISVAFMILGIILILPLRKDIIGLFTNDPATIEQGVQYMLYIGLGLPLMAIFQIFFSTYQGSGETKFAMVLGIVRLWIFRLPLVFLAIAFTNMGPLGIWLSMLISNFLATVLGYFLYRRVKFVPKIRRSFAEG